MAQAKSSVPMISGEGGLSRYMQAIRQFPMLAPREELDLATAWRTNGDPDAMHRLVTSHLRLVVKMAMSYRYYGLPVTDLISEGNLGLIRAVEKFEPEKGFRLATYAMWWIKAAINEYVLNSWSLVKMGTVAAQKKLFFNLRRIKSRHGIYEDGELTEAQATLIAGELCVSVAEVHSMNRRLSRQDSSLDAPVGEEGDLTRVDMLVDSRSSQEELLADKEDRKIGSQLLKDALATLNEREREIITGRRLRSKPMTLDDLGTRYGISRERVRQIENRAFQKLQQAVQSAAAALSSPALPLSSAFSAK